ncbi:MAG TPA: amidase, partial [Gemmatimonadaceae bacterium]|nr:amidase [Gemmatimonadaceae bacterium]
TSRQVTERLLERIARMDRGERGIYSVIETNPEALAIAESLDAERRAGRERGPLHGIPILLKDNIATADRNLTTAGSWALAQAPAPRDAFVAARLREAGAVLLGKANLSEWANFRSTRASSGWSARGGQCRNPYALDRSPSGSSSGSAVAVAASFCAVAVGTETDGSIVSPAAACSIVGIKPTVGLVSRAGIIPISHTQDTAGPMARTVADAAVLLGALVGVDARDAATAASGGHAHADYTRFLDADALRGARIGVPREKLFGYHRGTDALAEEAIALMRERGAVIIDPAPIPTLGQFDDAEFEVLLYDFKADIAAYLATLGEGAPARTLADLIAFNESHAAREMPYFGQEIFLQAQEKGPLASKGYRAALDKCRRLSRTLGIDAVMKRHRLDALVAPTQGPSWPTDLTNGDHFIGGSSTIAAVAGYPSITVPMGYVYGLPVGLSFFGGAWSEPRLIALAHAYEQASRLRRPPAFLETADFGAVPAERG